MFDTTVKDVQTETILEQPELPFLPSLVETNGASESFAKSSEELDSFDLPCLRCSEIGCDLSVSGPYHHNVLNPVEPNYQRLLPECHGDISMPNTLLGSLVFTDEHGW